MISDRPMSSLLPVVFRCAARWILLSMLAVGTTHAGAAETAVKPLTFVNPGFETGLAGWVADESAPMSRVMSEAAHTGGRGLRVVDDSTQEGSSVHTEPLAVESGRAYRVSLWARCVSGKGIAVYLRFFGVSGKQLNPSPKYSDQQTVESQLWRQYTVTAVPPEGAATFDVRIHSFDGSKVVADLDDLEVEAFLPGMTPPWPPTYKFDLTQAEERARLTTSDVVGPDGLVYPNWRHAGVPGGIPTAQSLPVIVGKDVFANKEGRDIADLLQQSVEKAAAKGGGVVELPPGRFLLGHSIVIRDSGVVIRGAGKNQTHLLYTDHIPYGTVRSWSWNPSGKIGPDSFFEIQANPKNLVLLRATSDGKPVTEQSLAKHWGNRFYLRMKGSLLLQKLGPGRHRIDAEVGYANGDRFTQSFDVEVSATPQPGDTWADEAAALLISGPGITGPKFLLTATAQRGDNRLALAPGHGFAVGDRLMIEAPATPRWDKLTGKITGWGIYRTNHYKITAVTKEGVTVDGAFRIDFPLEDGSYVQRIGVVERSGIEGLTIEQKVITTELKGPKNELTGWYPMEDLWTDGVTICYGWGCWLRDVGVINAGRNPLYITRSKQCELIGLEARGALFKGGGGTGYVGIERSFDCIMEGAVTEGMRHAPDVQWGSAGNVIRNGHFTGSDGQWHAGWTHENLFENNVIEQTLADMANGSYGHGLYASGPSSPYHGPQGPRNVVYNNDIVAPKNGLHMVGGNEGWLILHNRFRLDGEYAVYGKEKSFDHTIRDNVFIMTKPASPVVLFESSDCTGIELTGNAFYGPVRELAGFTGNQGRFAKVSDNTVAPLPATKADIPARPQPAVPSIFEWQLNHPKP
ncbi:MAG TPA: carbohydrate binding domain-containing protein [Chthoniobacter sp.]|nr:carbohydrate binding domain-containing protein [Chthoniobacter sp.]